MSTPRFCARPPRDAAEEAVHPRLSTEGYLVRTRVSARRREPTRCGGDSSRSSRSAPTPAPSPPSSGAARAGRCRRCEVGVECGGSRAAARTRADGARRAPAQISRGGRAAPRPSGRTARTTTSRGPRYDSRFSRASVAYTSPILRSATALENSSGAGHGRRAERVRSPASRRARRAPRASANGILGRDQAAALAVRRLTDGIRAARLRRRGCRAPSTPRAHAHPSLPRARRRHPPRRATASRRPPRR